MPGIRVVVRWLDVVLLMSAAGLIIAGPVMALQEVAALEAERSAVDQERARAEMLGEPEQHSARKIDTAHRVLWVSVMPLVVVGTSALGFFTLMRVTIKRNVRTYARRPGLVLLGGMALLAFTYMLDLTVFFEADYVWRLLSVPWLYAFSGVLLVGSAYQLAALEETFAPVSPLNIPNETVREPKLDGPTRGA